MIEQAQGDTLVNPVGTTVKVSRSVSLSAKEVWKLLATRQGAEALLGAGGELGDKGDSWHAADGTYGVVRSFHPLEQIRFTWHAAEEAPKTIVELDLVPDADGTRLELSHQGVPSYFDAGALEHKWERALELLALAAG